MQRYRLGSLGKDVDADQQVVIQVIVVRDARQVDEIRLVEVCDPFRECLAAWKMPFHLFV